MQIADDKSADPYYILRLYTFSINCIFLLLFRRSI